MKASLYVRPLLGDEEHTLQKSLKSQDSFQVRRAQLILASARGVSVPELSRQTLFSRSTIRALIHQFEQQGLAALSRGSHRPKSSRALLDESLCQQIQHLLHQSPRMWGQSSSLWSLKRLAFVLHQEGYTPHVVSYETVRRALKRQGIAWKRAKHWITSPDPGYARKKTPGSPDSSGSVSRELGGRLSR